jgi:hypothetical protein
MGSALSAATIDLDRALDGDGIQERTLTWVALVQESQDLGSRHAGEIVETLPDDITDVGQGYAGAAVLMEHDHSPEAIRARLAVVLSK